MAVVTARWALAETRLPGPERPEVRVSAADNRTIVLSEKQSQPGMSQSQPGTSQSGTQPTSQ
jgi:hypothetical protein